MGSVSDFIYLASKHAAATLPFSSILSLHIYYAPMYIYFITKGAQVEQKSWNSFLSVWELEPLSLGLKIQHVNNQTNMHLLSYLLNTVVFLSENFLTNAT